MKNSLVVLFLLFFIKEVNACSCFFVPSFYYFYNQSERVFEGRIIKILNPTINQDDFGTPPQRNILIEVIARYKGVFNTDTIVLQTGCGSGACGLSIETGDLWILFSSDNSISICEPNYLIERKGMQINSYDYDDYFRKINIREELQKIKEERFYYVKEFDTSKKFVYSGNVNNGLAEGKWHLEYNNYEGLKQEDIFYKNGMVEVACYYDSTKLIEEEISIPVKTTLERRQFFKNGRLKSFSKDYGNGNNTDTGYFKNGSIRVVKTYKNDSLVISQDYYKGNKTEEHYFYDEKDILYKMVEVEGEEITVEDGIERKVKTKERKRIKVEEE